MSKEPKSYSLPSATVREIESIAKQKKVSNSKIVCDALDFYLGHRSIEGTVRSEMAKVDSSVQAILKSLLVFATVIDEGHLMIPLISSKIGEASTNEIIQKIRGAMMKKGETNNECR